VTLSISDPSIKAGDVIYTWSPSGVVPAGTATVDGSATVSFTTDPVFVVAQPPLVQSISVQASTLSGQWNTLQSTVSAAGTNGSGGITYTLDAGENGNASSSTCSLVGTIVSASGPGTCYVYASIAADAIYAAASSSDVAVVFTAATQKVLSVSNQTLTGVAGTAIPLTSSGGSVPSNVTFSVTGSGCVITNGALMASGADTCVVTASSAATQRFKATTSTPVTFTFTLASQTGLTISNTTLTGVAGTPVSLTTTGGSGVSAVTFGVTGTGCTLNGSVLTASGAVTCVVTAVNPANGIYDTVNATAVTFTFALAPQTPLSISNTTLTGSTGTPLTLTTTGGSGNLAVTFSVTGTGCAVTGSVLNVTGAATCVVTAVNPANGIYADATSSPVTFTFTATSQTPVVLAAPSGSQPSTGSFTLSASGGSGTIAYVYATTSPGCSINGTTLTFTGTAAPSTCIVTASNPANGIYQDSGASSPVTFTFNLPASTTPPQVSATFSAAPGQPIANSTVTVSGSGFQPNVTLSVWVDQNLSSAVTVTTDASGAFSTSIQLPAGLPVGSNSLNVGSISGGAPSVAASQFFTVATGGVVGTVGSAPPGPLGTMVQYVPSEHAKAVLAATGGAVAAAGAASSALSGGLGGGTGGGAGGTGGGAGGSRGGGTGGSRSGGGGSRGGGAATSEGEEGGDGSEGGSSGSSGSGGGDGSGGGGEGSRGGETAATSTVVGLEGIELEIAELEREKSRGKRRRGAREVFGLLETMVEDYSRKAPSKLSKVSAVVGRISIDGEYLRAISGVTWLILCVLSILLGLGAAFNTHFYAVPPTLHLFMLILGLSILDAFLGSLAAVTFLLCAMVAGHFTTAPEIRLAMGMSLGWFAVPLAASAMRPLRRLFRIRFDHLWEHVTDVVVGGVFAGWVATKLVDSLSALGGVELPIAHQLFPIFAVTFVLVSVRIAFESFVAHHRVHRLEVMEHEGELEPPMVQRLISMVMTMGVVVFVSSALVGMHWELWVGLGVFYIVPVLGFFKDRLPRSVVLGHLRPSPLIKWTLIIVLDIIITITLHRVVHSGAVAVRMGFVFLPLPIVGFSLLDEFSKAPLRVENVDDIEQADGEVLERESHTNHEISQIATAVEVKLSSLRHRYRWFLRLGGVGLFYLCVYLVTHHVGS
jgi:hypothetical protein